MSTFTEITFTSNDGLRLYARDYAAHSGVAKCPVICIHGLTRNSSDFEEVAPWIASLGRRVIAVDVRGRGYSAYDTDGSHYQPAVYAADIVKLSTDLGIARAVFIGTSMGGIITMTLALRHLDLVAGAILNDVGPVLSQPGLDRIGGYAGKGQTLASWADATDYIKSINQLAFPDNSREEWGKWARRAFAENAQGKLALRYDPNIALALQNGKLKASSAVAKFAFRRLAKKRPTLLIRGALSDLITIEQSDYMRAVAPAMLYAEVPGVGHAPMLTETVAMTAIRNFLAQVD
ncbi:alpha/beta fold hydrolase [Undibacterium sp. Ren11W]|uniref:alpha/beta fold hydrolase n=1 Tax=Undibacterium sp. Ren11W TaxID=3413045 RepID=UPI003BEF68FE